MAHICEYSLGVLDLGQDGSLLSDFIKYQGNKPLLNKIHLPGYSMPLDKMIDLFQFLCICTQCTHLNLSETAIGKAGHQLAQSIRSWGEHAPLKELYLQDCSIPKEALSKVLQSLSTCRQLIALDLGQNALGETVHDLAKSIRSWGNNPSLQQLYLHDCSMPLAASRELLMSLSSCKDLKSVDFGGNFIPEAGHQLAQLIKSWGYNPPLEQVYLYGCSLTPESSSELLCSLATCNNLTHLDLRGNTLGEAGHHLAHSIRSWGDNAQLQVLHLYGCGLSEDASKDLLESLSPCKHLTELNLGENTLGEAGHHLAESIRSWGDLPPLEGLFLSNCSMPIGASSELLQSLATCRKLIHLDLRGNILGEAGNYLAQSIRSWGHHPPIEQLYIHGCLIPDDSFSEILKSLLSCTYLTHLDFRRNTVGKSGSQLIKLIGSWGDTPLLEQLFLHYCLIPVETSIPLLESLETCKYLTHLDFRRNVLGEAGHHLAKAIRTWGDDPPLQELYLYGCSLSPDASIALLQSLSRCKYLTHLDLGRNNLGKGGYLLANIIRSHGDNSPLKQLYMYGCLLPAETSTDILQCLSKCRSLTHLDLGRNMLGESGVHVAELIRSWGDNPPLQQLYLYGCSLTENASNALLQSLSTCTQLTELNLGKNSLGAAGHQLAMSIRSWGDDPQLQCLYLANCMMPVFVWNEILQALAKCTYLTKLDTSNDVHYFPESTKHDDQLSEQNLETHSMVTQLQLNLEVSILFSIKLILMSNVG